MMILRSFLTLTAMLVFLTACNANREPLQVGGKQSPEDLIVAELIAEMAQAEGIPVQRRIGLGGSRVTMEALKRGEVDLYPEYTGSGLALLGLAQPPDADSMETLQLLRERYSSLGLDWSEPLGFESRPELVMLRERARELGIQRYSDLAQHADRLTLGVDSDFRERPVDGLGPLLRRNGMNVDQVVEVPTSDRGQLTEQLMDGKVDIVQVRSSDPRIALFDLKRLSDDLAFFSRHDAAIVYRQSVLQRYPALEGIIKKLEGAIGEAQIQALSMQVALRGEDPREVVRRELIRLGLIDGELEDRNRQALSLAVSLSANAEGEAGAVLRQLRRSFPTSNVNLIRSPDPLGAVADGSVRLALVSAPAFFSPGSVDPATGQPSLREGFEAVALVGTSFLHTFALNPGVSELSEVTSIATGPVGSSGYRAAESVINGLSLNAEIRPIEKDSPTTLADALVESGADIAMLMQPIGNSTAQILLQRGLSLMEVENWGQRNNRIVYPYLQPARISPADYTRFLADPQSGRLMSGFTQPVNTLATQLLLAGPAGPDDARLASQGPGASFVPGALPLTNQAVERINSAIGSSEAIYPVLPQAPFLAPRLPQPPQSLNPSPMASLLSVLAIVLLVWVASLIVMKPRKGDIV